MQSITFEVSSRGQGFQGVVIGHEGLLLIFCFMATPTSHGAGYCSSYQFRCFNGQCVDSTKACNRINYDCTDNSDESLCSCE